MAPLNRRKATARRFTQLDERGTEPEGLRLGMANEVTGFGQREQERVASGFRDANAPRDLRKGHGFAGCRREQLE